MQVQSHAERLREEVAWQLRELPVASWSVREVCDWVEHLGLAQYRKRFLHQRISGDLLLQLTEDHLKVHLMHRQPMVLRSMSLKLLHSHLGFAICSSGRIGLFSVLGFLPNVCTNSHYGIPATHL